MGDRAPATFTVYTCPDQHTANAIIAIAGEYGFGYEWAYIDPTVVKLGEPFTDDQCSLGNDEYIARALQRLGVVAEVQQDAKYEFDGTQYFTHPTLGFYSQLGGNSGVMIPARDLEEAVSDPMFSESPLTVIYRLTGKAWRDAISEIAKELEANPVTWAYDNEHEECERCAAELAEATRARA